MDELQWSGIAVTTIGLVLSHLRLRQQLKQTRTAVKALEKIANTYDKEISLLQQATTANLDIQRQNQLRKDRELQWKIIKDLGKAFDIL